MDIAKNFAKVTVSDGNYDADDTSIVLLSGEGGKLPTAPFNVVWWNATDYPDPSDDPGVEIVRVTDVTSDTLTITRAQEGTAAQDHNVAGKTYKMIAALTAKIVNEELVGDIHGSGTAILVNPADTSIRLRQSATRFLLQTAFGTQIQETASIVLGDAEVEGNGRFFSVSDTDGKVFLTGLDIQTDRLENASTSVGSLVKKLKIYDENGTLVGYIPVYGSIT